MAKEYVDLKTLKYILKDVHNYEEILKLERFQDHDLESTMTQINSMKDFADRDFYPFFKDMDEKPAVFKNGKIEVHPQVEVIMKKSGELGLIAAPFDYEDGGLQTPMMASSAAGFVLECANNHLPGYFGLTFGAAELIVEFGSKELKDTYVPKMIAGEWGGTMCLTEPQAGSSLSDITTSATQKEDGSYSIKGQKIFISGGDHEYASNFVHLLLGRIEGAPAGTKGISLFVVPKNRVTDAGLESNDVITAGDFQKMGQRGYCTTHLIFGEQNDCQGWLVGQPNEGLKYMFLMMNGARISVGRGGAAIATAAYLASLEYAQERAQGRSLTSTGKKNAESEQTLIINHPDVRRMLLLQKSIAEGSLSLVLLTSKYYDLAHNASTQEEKEKYNLLLELLTPICKTYPSESGAHSINNGLQILGGYGFCSEYILQQYYRDIRIFALYEGTTGIQSQDLLGRKIPMKGGQALMLLAQEIMETISKANTYDDLKPYADKLGLNLQDVQKVMGFLGGFAAKGNYKRYLADATLFMDYFGKIVLAWLWLDMAQNAKQALVTGNTSYSTAFYESKIHTMKFFFKYELTKTIALKKIIMEDTSLTIEKESDVDVFAS